MSTKSSSATVVSRREVLRAGGLVAAGMAAGSAPQAPSGTEGGRAAGWEGQWEQVLAAAKRERTVVVQTPAGAGFREGLEAFAKAFPGVEPEQQAFPEAATYVPKILQERKAGIYTLDVAAIPAISPLQEKTQKLLLALAGDRG